MAWRAALRPLARTRLGAYLARSPLRPRYWRPSFDAARTLWIEYGHLRSVRARQSVDAAGEPVPWYTYPAIEFLRQFDYRERTVFEYGSGNSTMFWSTRAARVVSVDDDERWHEQVRPRVGSNCTLLCETDLRRYVEAITRYPEGFDIIIVDGPGRGRTRWKCARAARSHLRPGGLIVLDNSDWLPETSRMLRDSGLLQVDMSGFAPIVTQTQTTSLFFHRECQLAPRERRQPLPSAGARLDDWDTPAPQPGPSLEWEGHTIYGVVHEEEMLKAAPDGVRRFRIVIYTDRFGGNRIVLLDEDAGRILVNAHRPRNRRTDLHAEMARIQGMEWTELCRFVRDHDYRYYTLD